MRATTPKKPSTLYSPNPTNMTTETFPPFCSVGSNDDAVELLVTSDGRWICWQVAEDLFLRFTIYEGGERYYHLSTRQATQDTFLANYTEHDLHVADAEDRKKLRKMKLNRILRLIDKASKL